MSRIAWHVIQIVGNSKTSLHRSALSMWTLKQYISRLVRFPINDMPFYYIERTDLRFKINNIKLSYSSRMLFIMNRVDILQSHLLLIRWWWICRYHLVFPEDARISFNVLWDQLMWSKIKEMLLFILSMKDKYIILPESNYDTCAKHNSQTLSVASIVFIF